MKQGDEELLKVDCLGRARTPKEKREAILDEFERSGLPGTRFARLHGINYQTFASWIQKRRKQQGAYATKKKTSPNPAAKAEKNTFALAEVLLQPSSTPSEKNPGKAILIQTSCGARIELTESTQVALAAELLNALSRQSSC